MKILTLIIKQKYFDQIIKGEKTQEFREVRPNSGKKYLDIDAEGEIAEDEQGNWLARKYDAIRFYVGYNKDRSSALVAIKSAKTQIFVDEQGEPIIYESNGGVYNQMQVVYNLGDVLESNISN